MGRSVKSGSVAGGRGEREPLLDWPDGETPAHLKRFKEEVIWEHVFCTEAREHEYVAWMHTLGAFPPTYAAHESDGSRPQKGKKAKGSGDGDGGDGAGEASALEGEGDEDAGALSDS